MCQEGINQHEKGEYQRAFEYLSKAAELGNVEAHYEVAHMYNEGGVVEMDEGKKLHHMEEAAIGGHRDAKYYLGGYEYNSGNIERAVKHWIIAATHGHDDSIKALMRKNSKSKRDMSAKRILLLLSVHIRIRPL